MRVGQVFNLLADFQSAPDAGLETPAQDPILPHPPLSRSARPVGFTGLLESVFYRPNVATPSAEPK